MRLGHQDYAPKHTVVAYEAGLSFLVGAEFIKFLGVLRLAAMRRISGV
jgi:hypothetical protein